MKMQNNDTKDEGLKGNEKIEEAISALQQEPSQELLAHALTMIRRRMKEEGQFPFNQPFYLLIDMQLGGSWVGAVSPEDLPVEMEVDWVRFYQRKSLK